MTTKKTFVYACTIVICIAFSKPTMAQKSNLRIMPQNPQQMQQMAAGGKLTVKTFMAPNKAYGYDILSNGRIIYHQPAFSKVPADGDAMLTKKEQANTAAMMSIDKIKKGQRAELTNGELLKIIAHK